MASRCESVGEAAALAEAGEDISEALKHSRISEKQTQTPLEYFWYALTHGFTTYNAVAVCTLFFVEAPHARAITRCTSVGVAASFSSAFILDPTSFPRIAQRLGISMPTFHLANFVVHLLPALLVVLFWTSAPVSPAHALIAALLHLGWGVWSSAGTMTLDEIYVPLPRETWLTLWAIAVAAELLIVPALESSGTTWMPATAFEATSIWLTSLLGSVSDPRV